MLSQMGINVVEQDNAGEGDEAEKDEGGSLVEVQSKLPTNSDAKEPSETHRRPPGAWIGLSTNPAGSRRLDFTTSGHLRWRLDGLSTSQPTHLAAAPRLLVEERP
jgi:hypothetical protein